MSPERVAHTETKGEAYSALENAIAVARAPCRALTEGAAVRIDAGTVFEPDVLVYCGPRLPADLLEVSSPVIVVEAPSSGAAARDHGAKLACIIQPGALRFEKIRVERYVAVLYCLPNRFCIASG